MRFSALHTLEVLHATLSFYTNRRLLTRSSAALHARRALASDDLHFTVWPDFDDTTGLVRLVLLATGEADIVYGRDDFGCNVAVVLCCRLTTDVRTGAYNGLLESITELLRKSLASNTHADAAVFCDEVSC